jgi:hypothetical protein
MQTAILLIQLETRVGAGAVLPSQHLEGAAHRVLAFHPSSRGKVHHLLASGLSSALTAREYFKTRLSRIGSKMWYLRVVLSECGGNKKTPQ